MPIFVGHEIWTKLAEGVARACELLYVVTITFYVSLQLRERQFVRL